MFADSLVGRGVNDTFEQGGEQFPRLDKRVLLIEQKGEIYEALCSKFYRSHAWGRVLLNYLINAYYN